MIATGAVQKKRTRLAPGAPMVIAAAAILYLIGAGRVSLWDRDEAWYAQTSKQMLESGDWVVPRFLDSPRYAKPIFIYWCQAATMKLFGPTALAARIPSAVAMLGTISLLAVVLRRAVGSQRANLTILIFASSAIVIASAKMCLTDSVMLFFLTIAQLALYRIYKCDAPPIPEFFHVPPDLRAKPRPLAWWVPPLFWLSLALAVLTKGPFPMVVLLATMVLLAILEVGAQWRSTSAWMQAIRWWKKLRPILGLAILIVIVAPWLIMLYRREPGALRAMLGEPVRHLTSDQDSQWVYPGYYPLTIWLTFFPWSLLLPAALIHAWKRRKQATVRFALATILGNWIFVELMITKLPHYMLPSFSSLAFLCGYLLYWWSEYDRTPRAMRIGSILWGCAAAALAFLPWLPHGYFPLPLAGAIAFTAIGFIYAVAVPILWNLRQPKAAAYSMGFGMMLVIAILFGLYFPNANFLRVPQLTGEQLRQLHATDAIMIGFTEPSLAFYQGGAIRPRPDDFLAAQPPADWPTWIVLTSDVYQSLPADRRDHLEQIASFRGFNYNIPMRPVTVIIARKRSDQN